MELTFAIEPKAKPKKGVKINWTQNMIQYLVDYFPTTFNKTLANQLGIGWRSVVRKARELGLEKEPGFLEKNRNEIQKMAVKAHPSHPFKGVKGWKIPNSENTQFKKGQISCTKNPEILNKIHKKRNETLRRDKLRQKLGLPALTKFNFDPLKKKQYNVKCKVSDWGCVYHACMSDHCQKRFMKDQYKEYGPGKCKTDYVNTSKLNKI